MVQAGRGIQFRWRAHGADDSGQCTVQTYSNANIKTGATNVSKFSDAENAISKELVRLEGLYAARDELRALASLEGAIAETQARLDAVRTDEQAALAGLENTRAECARAQSECDASVVAAK